MLKIDELSRQEIESLAQRIGEDWFAKQTIYKLGYRSPEFIRVLLLTQSKKEYGVMDMTDDECKVHVGANLDEDLERFRQETMSKALRCEVAKMFESTTDSNMAEKERNI